MRNVWRIAEIATALVVLGARGKPASPAPDAADLVFKNGRIYTVDAALPWASSLVVDGGKITAVGSDDQATGGQMRRGPARQGLGLRSGLEAWIFRAQQLAG